MAKRRRAKKQISKVNPKMGYFGGPNMPLSQKSGFKTILVSFWRPNREEREKREKKRRRRRRRSSQAIQRYGNYLEYGFSMDACLWYGTLRLCMINIMSPNLGFSVNCILTFDFLKLRWVKPIRNKINKESSPFKMDSWLIESL